MTKKFTKGQKVTYFARWNAAGDFAYTQAVVYSCGNKRMVLTAEETGIEMGRQYSPDGRDGYQMPDGFILSGTVDRMSDAEAEQFCNDKAAQCKAHQLARLDARIASGDFPNNDYWNAKNAALRESLNAAPVAHKRDKI